MQDAPIIEVLGLPLADVAANDLVTALATSAANPGKRPQTAFAVHIGGLLNHGDSNYVRAMQRATFVYADGVSATLLARLAGAKHITRAPTTDVGWQVLDTFRHNTHRTPRLAAIGGPANVAQRALETFASAGVAHPVYATHGYHSTWHQELEELGRAYPDILLVGLGAPFEMLWVTEHLPHLPPCLVMTCGGWFGHVTGAERRAPRWARSLGLEWLHRAYLQPGHLGPRYLQGMAAFPYLAGATLLSRIARTHRSP